MNAEENLFENQTMLIDSLCFTIHCRDMKQTM